MTNNFSLFYIFVIIYLVSLNLFFLFGLSIGFYIEKNIILQRDVFVNLFLRRNFEVRLDE